MFRRFIFELFFEDDLDDEVCFFDWDLVELGDFVIFIV